MGRPAVLLAAVTAFMLVLLAGCGAAGQDPESADPPAAPGARYPYLHGAGDRLLAAWLEPIQPEGFALRHAELAPGGWSTPRTIAQGRDWFINWADSPSLVALEGGGLAAHWLQVNGPGPYSYDVRLALSADGERWGTSLVPHGDGTATEHGFVSLVPRQDGGLMVLWLDGRDYAGRAEDDAVAQFSLRYAPVGADAVLGEEGVIDSRTCSCCQTAAVALPDGVLVAYRGRSPEEVRDILVSRYRDGHWSPPRPVYNDGWIIKGCPVNGPALAAQGQAVVVLWYTAAGGQPQVRAAFSRDGGLRFGTPLRIDAGRPLGRVSVAWLPDGDAVALWLEQETEPERAAILPRRISADGHAGPPRRLTAVEAGRGSGFPQLAVAGGEVVVAWTEVGQPSRVRALRQPINGL